MEIEFVQPQTVGEWMAWLTALACVLVGFWVMLMPRTFLRLLKLAPSDGTSEGISQFRGAFGGFWVGLGIAALLLHPQPLIYLAIGFAFAFAVVGRLLTILINRSFSPFVAVAIVFEAVSAFFTLAYALAWIG